MCVVIKFGIKMNAVINVLKSRQSILNIDVACDPAIVYIIICSSLDIVLQIDREWSFYVYI